MGRRTSALNMFANRSVARAVDDELVAVAVVGDVVLAEDVLGEARVGHGDEGVELRRAVSTLLAAPPRGHDLAGAHVEADGVRAGLHQVLDPLLGLLGDLPEVVLALVRCRYPPLGWRGAPAPLLRSGHGSSSLSLLGQPPVVEVLPLRAGPRPRSCPRAARLAPRARSAASRTPGQGSPSTFRKSRRSRSRTAPRWARRVWYWSGSPNASNGKPRAQSRWCPIRCFLRVHAGEAVRHAHLGRDLVALAQVVGQAAARRELRLRDRQRAAALPARLERDARGRRG